MCLLIRSWLKVDLLGSWSTTYRIQKSENCVRRCMFWPEMNISPYVSCVFWKTMLGVARGDQNLPTYLKFNEESNEHGADFRQLSASVLPVHFRSQRPPTQLFFTFLKMPSTVRGTSEPFYTIQSSVRKIAFLCWWYLSKSHKSLLFADLAVQ